MGHFKEIDIGFIYIFSYIGSKKVERMSTNGRTKYDKYEIYLNNMFKIYPPIPIPGVTNKTATDVSFCFRKVLYDFYDFYLECEKSFLPGGQTIENKHILNDCPWFSWKIIKEVTKSPLQALFINKGYKHSVCYGKNIFDGKIIKEVATSPPQAVFINRNAQTIMFFRYCLKNISYFIFSGVQFYFV